MLLAQFTYGARFRGVENIECRLGLLSKNGNSHVCFLFALVLVRKVSNVNGSLAD